MTKKKPPFIIEPHYHSDDPRWDDRAEEIRVAEDTRILSEIRAKIEKSMFVPKKYLTTLP